MLATANTDAGTANTALYTANPALATAVSRSYQLYCITQTTKKPLGRF